jgi:hypothetical protein
MKENIAVSENIILELEALESSDPWSIQRGWCIFVKKDAPLLNLQKGNKVRLTTQSQVEAFYTTRAIPLNIPDPGEYQCVWPFRILQGSVYVDIHVADQLELSWAEAYPLLVDKKIKPLNFKLFSGGAD